MDTTTWIAVGGTAYGVYVALTATASAAYWAHVPQQERWLAKWLLWLLVMLGVAAVVPVPFMLAWWAGSTLRHVVTRVETLDDIVKTCGELEADARAVREDQPDVSKELEKLRTDVRKLVRLLERTEAAAAPSVRPAEGAGAAREETRQILDVERYMDAGYEMTLRKIGERTGRPGRTKERAERGHR